MNYTQIRVELIDRTTTEQSDYMSEMASATFRSAPRPEARQFPYGVFIVGLFLWPLLIVAAVIYARNNKAYTMALAEYYRGLDPAWYWQGFNGPNSFDRSELRKDRRFSGLLFSCIVGVVILFFVLNRGFGLL